MANDKIIFSLRSGGVSTVPLGSGPVEPIAESAGMHLLTWPWAGTPGPGGRPETGPVVERRGGPLFERIRNLETRETATAVVHAGEQLRSCGVRICLGIKPVGNSIKLPTADSTGRILSYPLGDDLYMIDLSKIR
ncbi:hypothetical protein [Nonomuraea sp. NPDC048901]|uniref:hypothetical protein n=1 Tax=Nonomuraea sp. NPDC048901 TaxID=3155627 RepID=UPI0033D497A8